MGASRAIVLLTFVLWKFGLFMAAMVAGGNNCQAFEVSTSVQGAIQGVRPARGPVPAEGGQLRAVTGDAPPGDVPRRLHAVDRGQGRQRRHHHRHLPHLPRGRRLLQPTPRLLQDQADEGVAMPNPILPDIHEDFLRKKERIHGGDPDGDAQLYAAADPCGRASSLLGWSVLLFVVGPGSSHVGPSPATWVCCICAGRHATTRRVHRTCLWLLPSEACGSLRCGIQIAHTSTSWGPLSPFALTMKFRFITVFCYVHFYVRARHAATGVERALQPQVQRASTSTRQLLRHWLDDSTPTSVIDMSFFYLR